MAFRGLKVIELGGLAPVPFCGLVLADHGARVIRITNRNAFLQDRAFVRGKESLELNFKDSLHKSVFRRLCAQSDVLIDPYRPGVLERLSLGPDLLFSDNPALIVARISGFGQSESPMQQSAGHDLNYLAESGVLSTLRGPEGGPPRPPVNYLADFAGGGLLCAFGIAAALFERSRSGKGQVVDCSMTEGAAYVASFRWLTRDSFFWGPTSGSGMLDGGAHFYRCYRTKDGQFMSVAAIEPQFYAALVHGLGLTSAEAPQFGGDGKALQAKFEAIFALKTAQQWGEVFAGTDACVAVMREWSEAQNSPLAAARASFLDDGSPAPAPRFSAHPQLRPATHAIATPPQAILEEHGCSAEEIAAVLKPHAKM